MSLRKLKFHEQKLLKKTRLISDDNQRELEIIRRYYIQRREDYYKYNKLVGEIRKIAHRLSKLDPRDPFRIKMTQQLLDKLYNMGLINTKKGLSQCEKITASSFCRRRLPVVMVRLKMCQHLKQAVTLIEAGHVRVGPETVTDPAFLVTRTMEDFVTWVDSSKIKATIQKYNDKLDDFTLLGS